MADSNISSISFDELVVPVKAATVFAAMERSLFLGGELIPVVNTPTGFLKVPFVGAATATSIAAGTITSDVPINNPGKAETTIEVDLIAARSVVRDLGSIDPMEIGRMLGMSVAKAFDTAMFTALDSLAAATAGSNPISIDLIFDAVTQIRAQEETGALYGIVTPAQAAIVLKEIGTAAYAGGEMLQGTAVRNGYLGQLAGVKFFSSSYITTAVTSGYIFGEDAARIAMQKNVDIEVARRAESVGFDVVASLHATGKVVDSTRGVKLV